MSNEEITARSRANAFKHSVAADLYTSEDLVDFKAIMAAFEGYKPELSALQKLVADGDLGAETLATALLEFPRLYQIFCAFLSITTSVSLADGRRLPSPVAPPRDLSSANIAMQLLLELGLGTVLNRAAAVEPLFLMMQISLDAPKRRFRVDARIANRIQRSVESVIHLAAAATGKSIVLGSKSLLPLNERRIVEYLRAPRKTLPNLS